MPAQVFISHAVKDRALAEALADLILSGLSLQPSNVFCSSLAGLGIPAGSDFKSYIRDRLTDSSVVIALLTPNYYDSAFCLCEAGATWVMAKDFVPLVASNSTFEDMKGVLVGTQALKLEQETSLEEMRERIEAALGVKGKHAWWSKKRTDFQIKLPEIISSLEKPIRPSATDYANAVEARKEIEAVSEQFEKELRDCRRRYDEVAKLKDRAAVQDIELKTSGEEEKFERLEAQAQNTLKGLSSGLVNALFKRERGEVWIPGPEWDDRLDDDIERGLLHNDEGVITPNEEHPRIRPAVSALSKLAMFVDREADLPPEK